METDTGVEVDGDVPTELELHEVSTRSAEMNATLINRSMVMVMRRARGRDGSRKLHSPVDGRSPLLKKRSSVALPVSLEELAQVPDQIGTRDDPCEFAIIVEDHDGVDYSTCHVIDHRA